MPEGDVTMSEAPGAGSPTAQSVREDDDDNTVLYIIIAFAIFGFLLILVTVIIAACTCTCRRETPSKNVERGEQDDRYDVIEHDYNEHGTSSTDGALKSTEPSVVGLTDPIYAADFESTVLSKGSADQTDSQDKHDVSVEIENDQYDATLNR